MFDEIKCMNRYVSNMFDVLQIYVCWSWLTYDHVWQITRWFFTLNHALNVFLCMIAFTNRCRFFTCVCALKTSLFLTFSIAYVWSFHLCNWLNLNDLNFVILINCVFYDVLNDFLWNQRFARWLRWTCKTKCLCNMLKLNALWHWPKNNCLHVRFLLYNHAHAHIQHVQQQRITRYDVQRVVWSKMEIEIMNTQTNTNEKNEKIKIKIWTPKELRIKSAKSELYIKMESPDFKINPEYWKPRCVDYVYNDYSCVLITLEFSPTFPIKWVYCNKDGNEIYEINK